MSKRHVVFLTEEEIKALANLCRVSLKLVEDDTKRAPYFEELYTSGGKSAFDKLMEKISEINGGES
jgi:hypothetical protein